MLKFWFCFTLLAEIEELNRMNSSSEVFRGIIRQVIVAQITQMADGLIQKRKRKALHKGFSVGDFGSDKTFRREARTFFRGEVENAINSGFAWRWRGSGGWRGGSRGATGARP